MFEFGKYMVCSGSGGRRQNETWRSMVSKMLQPPSATASDLCGPAVEITTIVPPLAVLNASRHTVV